MENALNFGPIGEFLRNWIAPWAPIIAVLLFIWTCSGWFSGLRKTLDDMKSSLSTIETAITQVDLKTMEHDISVLIGARIPSSVRNTVDTILKKTGIKVSVSLSSLGNPSELEMRFDRRIEPNGLTDLIIDDKDLKNIEKKLFGSEVRMIAYSPRALKFLISSQDIDSIAAWAKVILEKLDDFIIITNIHEKTFDKKLEELL